MTWDFALGVLVGLVAAAGVPIGIGYERFRLSMAKRPATKPAQVAPDPAPVTT
jgi:hypothetical protein